MDGRTDGRTDGGRPTEKGRPRRRRRLDANAPQPSVRPTSVVEEFVVVIVRRTSHRNKAR